MIKLLLGSALLALSAAEADPQVLLNGAVLPALPAALPYVGATVGAVAHVPVVKNVEVTPAEVEHEVTAHPVAVGYYGHPHYGYYGYGLGYRGYRGCYGYPYGYRYYGKRSADAEPAVLAGGSRVISAPTPLIHNPPALPAVTYAAHPLAYHAGLPLAGHLGYAGLPYAGLPLAGLPVVAAPAAAEEAVVAE